MYHNSFLTKISQQSSEIHHPRDPLEWGTTFLSVQSDQEYKQPNEYKQESNMQE